jgi:hypothetical protein
VGEGGPRPTARPGHGVWRVWPCVTAVRRGTGGGAVARPSRPGGPGDGGGGEDPEGPPAGPSPRPAGAWRPQRPARSGPGRSWPAARSSEVAAVLGRERGDEPWPPAGLEAVVGVEGAEAREGGVDRPEVVAGPRVVRGVRATRPAAPALSILDQGIVAARKTARDSRRGVPRALLSSGALAPLERYRGAPPSRPGGGSPLGDGPRRPGPPGPGPGRSTTPGVRSRPTPLSRRTPRWPRRSGCRGSSPGSGRAR